MKTLVFTFCAALIFITIISSCKHDDVSRPVPSTDSLAGTWELTSQQLVTNIPGASFDSTYQHGQSITVTYNTDSTYTSIDSRSLPADTVNGKFYILNGQLFDWSPGDTAYEADGEITFSGNTFILSDSASNGGVYATASETFTKL